MSKNILIFIWSLLNLSSTRPEIQERYVFSIPTKERADETITVDFNSIKDIIGEQSAVKAGIKDHCRIPVINSMQIDNIPDPNNWIGFDEILQRRAKIKLGKLKKIDKGYIGRGAGVVYATSSTYFQITLAGLLTLRSKTKLPIQVFHHDELTRNEIRILEKVSNTTVASLAKLKFNGTPIQFNGGFRNYHLKLAALMASSFKEILYIDDDNYIMQDPKILFESQQYRKTGMLLWKDVWKTNPKNPIYDIFDIPCKEGFENESGQILINKEIHYETLVLGYQILQQHDYWYSFIFGDKDVFRYAALALDKPFFEIERLPTFIGYEDKETNLFCGLVFLHKWVDGTMLFFHANNAKYRGMISKALFDKMQYNEDDQDLTQTAQLTSSRDMGCTTWFQHENSTTKVKTEKSNKSVVDFIDLWFGKIVETNTLINA